MNGKKTKKKVVKIIGLAIFMVGMGGYYYSLTSHRTISDDLALANMEALASGENGNYYCALSGDVDCHGMKVKVKIDNLSLDWE
mgnify:CR=1 FL=1